MWLIKQPHIIQTNLETAFTLTISDRFSNLFSNILCIYITLNFETSKREYKLLNYWV